MAATPPSNSNPSGKDRPSGTPAPVTFEDNLHQFWQKNRMVVLGLCAFVLVVILGKGVWERIQHSRETDIESEFAAATTPDQLRAFANAHPNHELAGVAEIRIADQAYTAEKMGDAIAGYEKALTVLKQGPLASRARLGLALAKVQTGKTAEAETELKAIASNTAEFKSTRAEAAYNLASLAADAHNYTDVQKYVEQLNQIDPASVWARRAVALQANMPKSASLASPMVPTSTSSGPNVQVKLPTK